MIGLQEDGSAPGRSPDQAASIPPCGAVEQNPASRRPRGRWLAHIIVLLLLAAGIRAAVWLAVEDGPVPYMQNWTESDMAFFRSWARGILDGDFLTERSGRPSHSWHDVVAKRVYERSGSAEPYSAAVRDRLWSRWLGPKSFYQDALYPYLLAAVWSVTGEKPGAVFFLQALLGLGTVALVYFVTARLFDEASALVAGALAALYGPLIMYESLLLRCAMITFLGIACLGAGLKAFAPGAGRRWFALCGALCGAAFLLKSSSILFFAVFLLLALRGYRREGVRALAPAAVCLGGFLLVVSPLAARNVAVGAPFWVASAGGGITFVNHNAADYRADMGDALSEYADKVMEQTGGRFFPAVAATIRTHSSIWSWVRLVGSKLLAFWNWYEVPNNASYDHFRLEAGGAARFFTGFALVGPLAAAGIFLGFRKDRGVLLALTPLVEALVLAAVFYDLGRFRVPAAVAMTPFAGFALAGSARRIRSGRRLRLAAAAAVFLAAGAIVWRPLPSGRSRIRIADYGVAGQIALEVAKIRLAHDDFPGALRMLEREIALEPGDLRRIRPGPEPGRLSPFSAGLAGVFAPLHEEASGLCRAMGKPERARYHARRARVLETIDAQYRSRSGTGR